MTEIDERQVRLRDCELRVLSSGSGPATLFIHGAGASADSFVPLMRCLRPFGAFIAPDLPGHGRSRWLGDHRSGILDMASALRDLAEASGDGIAWIVSHSAGSVVSAALAHDLAPRGHALINPAFHKFSGTAGWLFPAMARRMARSSVVPALAAAALGNRVAVRQLLQSTGSAVSPDMIDRYLCLARSSGHVQGTLAMMADWDLEEIGDRPFPADAAVSILLGGNDLTVPAERNRRIARDWGARLIEFRGGHLIHEEDPRPVAEAIEGLMAV